MLDKLCEYSYKWNVHVNVEKTKIVVFRNNFKLSAQDQWFYNGMQIDIVESFTYLGVHLFIMENLPELKTC